MLWVYGHKKYVYSYSAWIVRIFSRQILTTKVDPRAVRVKETNPLSTKHDNSHFNRFYRQINLQMFCLKLNKLEVVGRGRETQLQVAEN